MYCHFPVEIWVKIISQMTKEDLLVISRTCKFFGTTAQASLFREVSLKVVPLAVQDNLPDWVTPDTFPGLVITMDPRPALFQEVLTRRPELADHVHKFSVHYNRWNDRTQTEHYGWLPLVSAFSNLQALDFHGFYINSDFHLALHSLHLPRLRTISLRNSVICTTSVKTQIEADSPNIEVSELTLQELDLRGPSPPVVCAGLLRRFTVWFNGKSPEQTDRILSVYTLLDIGHMLTSLKVDNISSTLFHFLEATPQLRDLELHLSLETSPPRALSQNAIPSLEVFSGPARYAAMFVRGRPIRTATLSLEPYAPLDVLLPLQDSTVSVTSLTLVPHFKHTEMDMILLNLPHTLRHFAWETTCLLSSSEVASWFSALQHLPSLSVLETRTRRGWGFHPTFVEIYSEMMPSIREFKFSDFLGNYDRWLRRRDGDWEEYVTLIE